MTFKEFLPGRQEINSLLNGIIFTEDEKKERVRIAKKCNIKSWDDYLEMIYNTLINTVDLDKLYIDLSNTLDKEDRVGSPLIIINSNLNQAYINQQTEIEELFHSLPAEEQQKANQFDEKLLVHYFKYLLTKESSIETKDIDELKAYYKDLEEELKFANIDCDVVQKITCVLDHIKMKYSNAAFKESTDYFYLNKVKHLLPELHDELVKANLCEAHENFSAVFEFENLNSYLLPIKWKGKLHELGYLLWVLNGKKEFILGDSLDKMIYRLFCFDNDKNENTIRNSFKRSLKNFKSERYISSYLKRINDVLEKISLK